jgi:hypothetical protein
MKEKDFESCQNMFWHELKEYLEKWKNGKISGFEFG